MPVNSIYNQPATNAVVASMRPIIIAAKTALNVPMVFCDVYITSIYVGTFDHTIPYSKGTSDWVWQFDIRDKIIEYFSSINFPTGTPVIKNAGTSCKVFCKLRVSAITNGVLIPEGPEPVQAANGQPAVPGGGTSTNTFWGVHATIQHESNLNFEQHLAAYRTRQWANDALPLTHRTDGYPVAVNKDDFFSYILKIEKDIKKLRLRHRLAGKVIYQFLDYNIPAPQSNCVGTVTSVVVNKNTSPVIVQVTLSGTNKYKWTLGLLSEGPLQPVQDASVDLELTGLSHQKYILAIYPYCEDIDELGLPFSVFFVVDARPVIWKPDYTTGICLMGYANYIVINYNPSTGGHTANRTFDDGNGLPVTWTYSVFCAATNTTKNFNVTFSVGQLTKSVTGLGAQCFTALTSQSWTVRSQAPTGYLLAETLIEYYTDVVPNVATGNTKANDVGDPDYSPPIYDPETCPVGGGTSGYRSIQIKTSTHADDICGTSFYTAYISRFYFDIDTGVTVYTDQNLINPLLLKNFIVSQSGNEIFQISSVTGIVQNSTEATC